MSFRVRPELKLKMDEAAAKSGRSVAQEIELRLEQSFDSGFLGPRTRALLWELAAITEAGGYSDEWLTNRAQFNEVVASWKACLDRRRESIGPIEQRTKYIEVMTSLSERIANETDPEMLARLLFIAGQYSTLTSVDPDLREEFERMTQRGDDR